MKFFVGLITLGLCLSVEGVTYTLDFTITVPKGVLDCDGNQPEEISVTKSIVVGEDSNEFEYATAAPGRTGYAIPLSTLINASNLDAYTLDVDVGWKVKCRTATVKKCFGLLQNLTEVTVVSDATAEKVIGEQIATVTPLGRTRFDLVVPLSSENLKTFSRYVYVSWKTVAN